MSKINGGFSSFSAGPIADLTPHEIYTPIMEVTPMLPDMSSTIPNNPPDCGALTDADPYSGIQEYGAPDNPPAMDSDFSKLEHKLEHKPGVTNPAGLAAAIGRKELGQAEMTRRSVEGRKH